MSSVRMCDVCLNVFAEGEEGSGMAQISMMSRDEYDRPKQISKTQDYCANCNPSNAKPATRRPILSANVRTREDRNS